MLLLLRGRLVLLWCRLMLLWRRLVLLLLRSRLVLLWCRLALLLLLRSRLALLLLLWSRLTLLLLLRSRLALLLRSRLALLLLLRSRLALLLLLWSRLALLRSSLALLRGFLALLRSCLPFRRRLPWGLLGRTCSGGLIPVWLVLVWLVAGGFVTGRFIAASRLSCILTRFRRAALLRGSLIACLQRRWSPHVTICRERLVDDRAGGTAMVDTRKLSPIRAGSTLILHLRPHGCGTRLTQRRQFRGSRSHLDSTRSAVETHSAAAPVVTANGAVVGVVHHGGIHIVDRAVVVEVAATPVAALVTVADVAKAVVDAAIEADVLTPVATVEPVVVMPEAPVAGCPQSALVGSLNPHAGHPVIVSLSIGPVAGRPEIVVAGSRRLIVVGQRRRRLGSGIHRLLSVTRIFQRLIRCLVVVASRAGWRRTLLGTVRRWRLAVVGGGVSSGRRSTRACGCGGQVGRCRVR